MRWEPRAGNPTCQHQGTIGPFLTSLTWPPSPTPWPKTKILSPHPHAWPDQQTLRPSLILESLRVNKPGTDVCFKPNQVPPSYQKPGFPEKRDEIHLPLPSALPTHTPLPATAPTAGPRQPLGPTVATAWSFRKRLARAGALLWAKLCLPRQKIIY